MPIDPRERTAATRRAAPHRPRLSGVLHASALFLLTTSIAVAERATVSVLPGMPLVADGSTPGTIFLEVEGLADDGPVRIKVRSPEANTGEVVDEGGGVFAVTLVPSPVDTAGRLSLDVKVRAGTDRFSQSVEIPVVPAASGPVRIAFEPATFRTGSPGVLVRLKAPGSAQDPTARRFVLRASTGTVDTPVAAGDGSWVARWTPPRSLSSAQMVMFTAIDPAAPDAAVGLGVLPVIAKQEVTFDAPPNSMNLLISGDRRSGPLPVGADGKVRFEVEIDPRQPTATLQSVAGTERSERAVDLPVAGTPQLDLFPPPDPVLAGSSHIWTLHVAAIDADGTPAPAPELTATAGSLSDVFATEVPGLYAATWSAPDRPGPVTFTAKSGDLQATATSTVALPLPSVRLAVGPNPLPRTQRDVKVTATVIPPSSEGASTARTGLDGPPRITALAGKRITRIRCGADGACTTTIRRASGLETILVAADPPATETGTVPARLLLWLGDDRMPADGQAATPVNVAVRDPAGLPVPGVPVRLTAEGPKGGLAASTVKTGPDGVARTTWWSSTETGLLTVRAEAAGLHAAAAVELLPASGPPGGSPGPLVPKRVSGPGPWIEEVHTLANAAPAVRVVREASPPVATAATTESSTNANDELAAATATTAAELPREGQAGPPNRLAPHPTASGPWARLCLGVGTAPHTYGSSSDRGINSPSKASFTQGDLWQGAIFGPFAVDARALVWPLRGSWGADLGGRAGFERLSVQLPEGALPERVPDIAWEAWAHVRYRRALAPGIRVTGAAGPEGISVPVLVVSEPPDPYDADSLPGLDNAVQTLWGGGASAGLIAQARRVGSEVEVGQFFAPAPVATRAGLSVTVAVTDALDIRLTAGSTWRRFRYGIRGSQGGDATQDIVRITDRLDHLTVGVSAPFE